IVPAIITTFLFNEAEFGDSTKHSPLHIVKDIKLVEGAKPVVRKRWAWPAEHLLYGEKDLKKIKKLAQGKAID
ncbi:hypothetical protein IIB34_08270, partial [PVC group bacterium]|nr:hypothetical protein [PVC group bacterium]